MPHLLCVQGIVFREEIRRNAAELINKVSSQTGGYVCIDARGNSGTYSSFRPGQYTGFGRDTVRVAQTIKWAKRFVPHGSTVFIASELEAALDVAPWRELSMQIYQSQMFPWIEVGYRRYQHLAAMDSIICTAPQANVILAANDSIVSQQICQARPSSCHFPPPAGLKADVVPHDAAMQ